jgi:hypothetical protein
VLVIQESLGCRIGASEIVDRGFDGRGAVPPEPTMEPPHTGCTVACSLQEPSTNSPLLAGAPPPPSSAPLLLASVPAAPSPRMQVGCSLILIHKVQI